MNQHDFEIYLDRQPKLSGTESVGRFVKNAFGIDEKVVLPESYWRYADWLKDTEHIDLAAYIVDCDKERGAFTLSENLMEWLYFDMKERQRTGLHLPDFLRFI